jgi:hypothetical protein
MQLSLRFRIIAFILRRPNDGRPYRCSAHTFVDRITGTGIITLFPFNFHKSGDQDFMICVRAWMNDLSLAAGEIFIGQTGR